MSDCDASEASGFGEASEADALDIDDGISMQDVDATAAVLPPHSLRDVCVMTLLFRFCSRSMFRTKCRSVSRRWSLSAPSSLAPRAAPNLAASTSAVHPAQAKLHIFLFVPLHSTVVAPGDEVFTAVPHRPSPPPPLCILDLLINKKE